MRKILLIEDNKDLRENTSEILTLASYTVCTAINGKEGVEIAQKEKPDIIICDIMMPVLDGYGVLHLLSKNEATANIPFIFLTAKAELSEIRKGMNLGADDYLTKPFDSTELLNAIESRFKRVENLRKEFSKGIDGLNAFINDIKIFEDFKKLSQNKEIRNYKKKDDIYKEGMVSRGMYLINKGKVKTYRTNEQGKDFITGLYKEGDFFGYLSLLNDEKHSESATAIDESELCLVSKEDFYNLMYKNVEVSRKFIKMITDNLQEKEEQLLKLAYNSVRKRIAEALITLYNRYNHKEQKFFSINFSREDLANLAGTATETTIRALGDFKEEGLIEVKGSLITIIKHDKLLKMKN